VTTARAFESLCRLAEAHAKLMMKDATSEFDCLTAIMLTENVWISTLEEYYAYLEQFNKKYHV
jgi:DNA replicative helicase MCM subunit Mcm2 (Cdc46/Mcm family)